MGATLNAATMMEAYALAEPRHLALHAWTGFDLRIMVEGGAGLRNQYGRDPREPREAPAREGGARPALRRLA